MLNSCFLNGLAHIFRFFFIGSLFLFSKVSLALLFYKPCNTCDLLFPLLSEHKCKQQTVCSGRRGGMECLNNANVRIIARLSHAHRPRSSAHTNILPESSAGIRKQRERQVRKKKKKKNILTLLVRLNVVKCPEVHLHALSFGTLVWHAQHRYR
jgi:hypothetical protein